ncbi:NADP-dependent oxidoreductase [Brevibacterium senegalense]|uniref:NADP-dependent oxidoreductase n=1 Tax=Brevibacterium senegalense TaxID=1033736 RepID=UPI000303205E|nr:NADP-dependent oxidoreductase [Brevibacterium senegalense]
MTRLMRIHGFDRFGSADVQAVHRVPEPTPGAGDVRIRVTAVSVNPGDIKVRSGQRQTSFPAVFPMAMGREAAGVVLETGADVPHGLRVGDRVFGSCASGIGALGEQTLLTAQSATPIPDGVDDAQAACIPVAVATAFDALEELRIGADDTLLVLGAGGGVGVHAIQLARHAGARVIGVASSAKADLVERFGGVHVASGPGWEDRVRAAAGGSRRVDALLDCVGGDVLGGGIDLLEQIRSPQPGTARVRSVADPAAASAAGGGGVTRRRTAEVFAQVAELVARGAIEVVVDRVLPFDEAARAVAHVESGHARGKTVVTLDGPNQA